MTVHMDLLNKTFAKLKYDAVLGVMSKLAPIDSFAGIFGVLTLACFKVSSCMSALQSIPCFVRW